MVFQILNLHKEVLGGRGDLADESAVVALLESMQLQEKVICENAQLSSLNVSTGKKDVFVVNSNHL